MKRKEAVKTEARVSKIFRLICGGPCETLIFNSVFFTSLFRLFFGSFLLLLVALCAAPSMSNHARPPFFLLAFIVVYVDSAPYLSLLLFFCSAPDRVK